MCRLFLMSGNYAKLLGKAALVDFCEDLELSMGGHGNGVAWRTKRGAVKHHKGVTLASALCARLLFDAAENGATELLFHTRMASSGRKSDELCHPFVHGRSALAHNGHDYGMHPARNSRKSDSLIMAQLLFDGVLEPEDLSTHSGTFVGWLDGWAFAQSRSGYDCCVCPVDDVTWMIASEIPAYAALGATYNADSYSWMMTAKSPCPIVPKHVVTRKPPKLASLVPYVSLEGWDNYASDEDMATWETMTETYKPR